MSALVALLQELNQLRAGLHQQALEAQQRADAADTPAVEHSRLIARHELLLDVNRQLVQAVERVVSQQYSASTSTATGRLAENVHQLRDAYLHMTADLRGALAMPGLNVGQRSTLELLAASYAQHALFLLMIYESTGATQAQMDTLFANMREGLNALIGGLLPPSSGALN